jgi:cell division protein FtsB
MVTAFVGAFSAIAVVLVTKLFDNWTARRRDERDEEKADNDFLLADRAQVFEQQATVIARLEANERRMATELDSLRAEVRVLRAEVRDCERDRALLLTIAQRTNAITDEEIRALRFRQITSERRKETRDES